MQQRAGQRRPGRVSVLIVLLALVGAPIVACGNDTGANGGVRMLTVVAAAPPENIGLLSRQGQMRAYDDLTADVLITRDPKDGSLQPQLATSWQQLAPDKWEFNLRPGVKFHDGTDFNAKAAAWAIEKQTNDESIARVVRYAANLTAEAKDDLTLVVTCAEPCPILDRVAPQLMFESPAWAEANPDKQANWPLGTGPYYLADWKEGQYLLYNRFEDYWGPRPYFDQVKVLWRSEPSVRASMVETGEAQLATELTPLQKDSVPKTFVPDPIDYARLTLRGRGADGRPDPVWSDVRFRQALLYAIDCDAMSQTLMNGLVKCEAVPFNPNSVGWVEGPRYTYDPVKARQLLDQVLGPGKQLDGVKIYSPTGDVPKLWAETIMSYWNDVGVHATFEYLDGDRLEKIDLPGPTGMPPDVKIISGHTNDLFDAGITLSYLDGCNEQRSYSLCDPDFVAKYDKAIQSSGEERDQRLQELTRDYLIGSAEHTALWQTSTIYGAAENLEWPNPQAAVIRYSEMSLAD